jgi:hypothetical protein
MRVFFMSFRPSESMGIPLQPASFGGINSGGKMAATNKLTESDGGANLLALNYWPTA